MLEEFWTILNAGSGDHEVLEERISKLVSFESLVEHNKALNSYLTENATKVQLLYPGTTEVLKSFFLLLSDIDEEVAAIHQATPMVEYEHRVDVVLKLFRKTRRTLLDAIPLFENGATISLFILWRSVFHDLVIAEFILSRDETVARNYNEYAGQPEMSADEPEVEADYSWTGLEKPSCSFRTIVKLTGEDYMMPQYILATRYLQTGPVSVNAPLFRSSRVHNPSFMPEAMPLPFNLLVRTLVSFSELVAGRFLKKEVAEAVDTIVTIVAHKLLLGETEE